MSLVQKYSDQLKKMVSLLSGLNIRVSSLNYSPAKYNPYGKNSKGVESDHLKIYHIAKYKSFGFGFNYTKVDAPYVMTTFKSGEEIVSSKYSEVAFKEKLKQFLSLNQSSLRE